MKMKMTRWMGFVSMGCLCIALIGCGAAENPTEPTTDLTKDQARQLMEEEGKQDRGRIDFCEKMGWYDDGVCDDFCPEPDPDCDADANVTDSTYEPCAGLTCGDTCTICDPNDPDCFETMVVKYCDAHGACNATAPACETDDHPVEPYEPCAGLTCGDTCTICDPNDPDCFETMEIKHCSPDGRCLSGDPLC